MPSDVQFLINLKKNQIKIIVTSDILMRHAFGSTNIATVVNFQLPIGVKKRLTGDRLMSKKSCNNKVYSFRAGRASQFGGIGLVIDFEEAEIDFINETVIRPRLYIPLYVPGNY